MCLSSQRFSGVDMLHADVNSLDISLAERLRMDDANFCIALRLFFFFFGFLMRLLQWPFACSSCDNLRGGYGILSILFSFR